MTSAPEPAPPPPTYSQQPPARKKWGPLKIILLVLAILVSLIILVGGGLFLLVRESTADAQKVSDDFVTAIQQGDGAKAWSLAGPTFRGSMSQADLDALVKQLSPLVTKDPVSP